MISQTKREMEVLAAYLPEQMSEEEILTAAKRAIEETGAQSMKDMGKVMAILTAQLKGRADGAVISSKVKELLS